MFAKFRLSQATSQRLYQAHARRDLDVHDPSYGDKAIDKLKGAVTPDTSTRKRTS